MSNDTDDTPQTTPQPSGPKKRKGGLTRGLSLNVMIPNMLTLLATCAGLTSVRYAMEERWEAAVLAIAVAAILDGLDGRVARLLKGASKFGAELDSLSDIICFGVAPAFILFMWALVDAGRFPWIATLVFPCCCALRLARFNTMLDEPNKPAWLSNYFTGVPAPAGAGLVLLPLVLSFLIGDDVVRHPVVVSLALLGVGFLLVSRVPTYSGKRLRIPKKLALPVMVFCVVAIAGLISATWLSLMIFLVAYGVSIPFAIITHRRNERRSIDAATPST